MPIVVKYLDDWDPYLGGGGGGSRGDTYGYGGSSEIRTVSGDANKFDIISPNPNLLRACQQAVAMSGSVFIPGANTSATHRWAFSAFGGSQGYPRAVGYHQQRRVFASTPGQPQSVWMSRIAAFPDFSTSSPILDNDSVVFTLASGQLNAVQGLLSLRKLLLLTSDNEWVVSAGTGTAITPSAIQADIQGYRGSSNLPPIGVGNVALYVQAKGQIVRDIGYDFASDSFAGYDLTVMAAHLLQGRSIVDWAFQQTPWNCIWMVRDDGVLLGATYLREQQVIGWHRHDTDGRFESVCVIPEKDEDALYVSVMRDIQGSTKRYIERFETRFYSDIRKCVFCDSALTFDGRTGYRGTTTDHTTTTMTVQNGGSWDSNEVLQVTASAPFFVYPGQSDEGDQIVFVGPELQTYRLTIISTSSTTVAQVRSNGVLPLEYRNTARTDWAIARTTISGLTHLEGKNVTILADGNEQAEHVVLDGKVSISPPGYLVTVGLPYDQDLQTLEILDGQTGPSLGKRKHIAGATVLVEDTRSIMVGRDFATLEEQRVPMPESYDRLVPTRTGALQASFATPWSRDGSLAIRNRSPLPVTILAVVPEVTVGG